jgi:hypothetical protein
MSTTMTRQAMEGDLTLSADSKTLWAYAAAGAGSHTVNLPANPADHVVIYIADEGVDFGVNNWTVDGNGALIDGRDMVLLKLKWAVLAVFWNGTYWEIF